MTPPIVLAVGLDAEETERLADAVGAPDAAELRAAPTFPRPTGEEPPALVVASAAALAAAEPGHVPRGSWLVALGGGDSDAARGDRVDAVLTRPLDPLAVLPEWRAALRLRTLRLDADAARRERDSAREALRDVDERMQALLMAAIEAVDPREAARAARVASLALDVAARFGVPEIHVRHLAIAARLEPFGRIIADRRGGAREPSGDAYWVEARRTRDLLSHWPGFSGAGELLAEVGEHWDGSGHPEHLQMGQIPLRARILRAVLDLVRAAEREDTAGLRAALPAIANHAGATYDPLVIARLEQALSDDGGATPGTRVRRLPVADLEQGMVLAEDVYSSSGMKLLARATRLTETALETLRRRHQMEPLSDVAVVAGDERAA